MCTSTIEPIIPFHPYTYDVDEICSKLVELQDGYVLQRFLLTGPGNGVRLSGFPDVEIYRQLGEFILSLKKKVADRGIQVGWWCAPSLKSGKAEYQRITGIDGKVSQISSCPLDAEFRKTFTQNVATVAEIAKPFVIQFEDDFELSNHRPVRFGCFCPLHLKEFAGRMRKKYSREDLLEIFTRVTPQSIQLRKAWAEMSRDSLTGLAGHIRQKIDKSFSFFHIQL